jgi:hypothetical protein
MRSVQPVCVQTSDRMVGLTNILGQFSILVPGRGLEPAHNILIQLFLDVDPSYPLSYPLWVGCLNRRFRPRRSG